MLSCREMSELTTDYLEGRLSLGERVRFRMHIAMCRDCHTYVRNVRELVETLGALPVSPEAPEELLERFRNWK